MQLILAIAAALLSFAPAPKAQAPAGTDVVSCEPAAARGAREFGCFIVASQAAGQFGRYPVFWHLSTYPTPAAAHAAKGPRDVVVEAFEKVWLLTLDERGWRPRGGGAHVAEIGPMPVDGGVDYTAQYMEAVFRPGMQSSIHRHAGPEAWYAVSGQMCLETPEGRLTGRAGGHPIVIPGGPPMQVTATGTEVRRALVLVLHHANQPATTPERDWQPKGLCRSR